MRRPGVLKLAITRPATGQLRFVLSLAIGMAGVCVIFWLLHPHLDTVDGNAAPWFAIVSCITLLAMAFGDRRLRRDFRQEIEVTPSKLRVANSDFSNLPIPVDFETARIAVTTTIPLVRGAIEFRESDSGRILSFCEKTPYYQRYFAAQKLGEYLDLEVTHDRELMEYEWDLVQRLEVDFERSQNSRREIS